MTERTNHNREDKAQQRGQSMMTERRQDYSRKDEA